MPHFLKLVLHPVGRTQNTLSSGHLELCFSRTPKMIVPPRKEWAPDAFTITFKVHIITKIQLHTWFEEKGDSFVDILFVVVWLQA